MEDKLKTVYKCCVRLKEESKEKQLSERQTTTSNYSIKALPRLTKEPIGRLTGLKKMSTKSDEKTQNKLAVDREISVWEEVRADLKTHKKKSVLKSLSDDVSKSDIILSSSATSSSVMSSSCVLSVASLQWAKDQYEERTSAGFGTPQWDEAQRKPLPRTKIKLPKWTTEYFLKKPGVAESQSSEDKRRGSGLSRPWCWATEYTAETPGLSSAPLLPLTVASRDSIGSCSSLIATLAQVDKWDEDGQEEVLDDDKVEKTQMVKLWPEDVITVDYRDEGYEEDWDSDEIDRDVEEIGRKGRPEVEKRQETKKLESIRKAGGLKLLEGEAELGVVTPGSSEFATIVRDTQTGQRDELRDNKQSSLTSQKDMYLDESVPRLSRKMPQRQSKEFSSKDGEKSQLGDIIERKISEGASQQTEEESPSSGPSSYSISSGSTAENDEWRARKNQKKGLDLLFSSSSSKFSSSSSCASDLDLDLASSDSDRSDPENGKPQLPEKNGDTVQQLPDLGVLDEDAQKGNWQYAHTEAWVAAAEHGSLTDLRGAMHDKQPASSSAAPRLDDFAPVYREALQRLHAIATGKDPDAAARGATRLREMSPFCVDPPAAAPRGPSPSQSPTPGAAKGRASRVSLRRGREALRRSRARSALHVACDRWLGPWRRAYVDLFQGDVNVILRTKEGHFLVVDLKLLKTLDLFKVQIDGMGNENFAKKVHYLPQVTFSNTIQVLLWCSFMQEFESHPNGTDEESIESEEESAEDDEAEKVETLSKADAEHEEDPSAESSDHSLDALLALRDTRSSRGSEASRRAKRRSKKSAFLDATRLKRIDQKESAKDLLREPKDSRKRASKKESMQIRESAKELSVKASAKASRKPTKADREGSVGSRSKHSSKRLEVAWAVEMRPEARAMLQALIAAASAGDQAQLAAAADALGAPTLWRGLMRDLARRAAGRRLPTLQTLLDPTLQARALGQTLCYARSAMDQEGLRFRQFDPAPPTAPPPPPDAPSPGRRRSAALAPTGRKARAKKKA